MTPEKALAVLLHQLKDRLDEVCPLADEGEVDDGTWTLLANAFTAAARGCAQQVTPARPPGTRRPAG